MAGNPAGICGRLAGSVHKFVGLILTGVPWKVIKPSRGTVVIGEEGSEVCAFLLAVFVPPAGLFLQLEVFPDFGIIKCNDASGLLTSRYSGVRPSTPGFSTASIFKRHSIPNWRREFNRPPRRRA